MELSEFTDIQVLVLAEGETPQAVSNNRGHLFELFTARLLEQFGYVEPTRESLNVTSDGIEIDVVVRHRLTKRLALAECKAYTSNIRAQEFTSFYGKLYSQRLLREEEIDGFFFALPRLNRAGAEHARKIEGKDSGFKYLNVEDVTKIILDRGLIASPPGELDSFQLSDHAIIITPYGILSSAKIIDPTNGKATQLAVWSADKNVSNSAVNLIAKSDYGNGLPTRAINTAKDVISSSPAASTTEEEIVIEVRGSKSDFEYQLPASPQYFVGRRRLVAELDDVISSAPNIIVLNAKSGWGKSSLALKLKQTISREGGHVAVFDTRTASHPSYVASALRDAALAAEESRLLQLPTNSSWASLNSALGTLANARWNDKKSTLLIFFDQFENAFRNETLTREFRNLALKLRDLDKPIVIGFAWKTDLVGWTEDYPYRLRDEIIEQAHRFFLPPLGPDEVSTLLARLQKNLGEKLVYDLRERLREYSQGLPWLFKKLAGHVLREVQAGVTQSELVSGALNVQNLFESDLAELQIGEREGLVHIARYAPVPASDVMDRVSASVINSLLHRRLIVQVGERLDTYWDTFRDFLVTGRVPIEDSYILRQHPSSVGRMLQELLKLGGDASVLELSDQLSNTEKVIYNLARDLRAFGVLAYEPNRVRLIDEIRFAQDPESALRDRVFTSLKRHRAYSTLSSLIDRRGGSATLADFTEELPDTFPAVAAKTSSWKNYARTLTQWFSSAGLFYLDGQSISATPTRSQSDISLFSPTLRARPKGTGAFPEQAPGPSMELLRKLFSTPSHRPTSRPEKRALRSLIKLGAVSISIDGSIAIHPDLMDLEGNISPSELRNLLELIPGAKAALAMLELDPHTSHLIIGDILRQTQATSWSVSSMELAGKHFRGWAKQCGITLGRAHNVPIEQDSIF